MKTPGFIATAFTALFLLTCVSATKAQVGGAGTDDQHMIIITSAPSINFKPSQLLLSEEKVSRKTKSQRKNFRISTRRNKIGKKTN